MRSLGIFILVLFIHATANNAFSQSADSVDHSLGVLARTSLDSIVLRWAPRTSTDWMQANRSGYSIERYTILRNGALVNPPKKKKLTQTALLPKPLAAWEPVAKSSKYGAIAAQALHGARFETTQPKSVLQIVNQVRESDQRFSIALLAADLNPSVAEALALRWVDRDVRKNEKYLYRIQAVPATEGYDTLLGTVFVQPEKMELMPPLDFYASFGDRTVELRWDASAHRGIYSYFTIERSENGKDFAPTTEIPFATLAPSKKEISIQYASDSLPSADKDYYYRVRGLTPFGESGPPSLVQKGRSVVSVTEAPIITKAESKDNRSMQINWEFPAAKEVGLKGFEIQRASRPEDVYQTIIPGILKSNERSFIDRSPTTTNYYQVVAVTLDNRRFPSPLHLAMLVDSIPPLPPKNLRGTIDDKGRIRVTWDQNSESDLYGYRVFRGNLQHEEFSQLTVAPMPANQFNDSVSLKTLTKQIHYQVMAVDQNQNQSPLSTTLSLDLPDQIPPQPPVLHPPMATLDGPHIRWTRSSSDDVVSYIIFKSELNQKVWMKLASLAASADTTQTWIDRDSGEGIPYRYTVIALDDDGLESEPAAPVTSMREPERVKPAVVVIEKIDRVKKQIELTWNYTVPGVTKYQIYRATAGEPLKLWATSMEGSFTDNRVVVNTTYRYAVVALFKTGARSAMVREISVQY
ncbi:MAG: hypothetical protein ACOYW3_09805 [Bacteroidota bacterium]